MVSSVGFPEGTITQTARGADSFPTASSRVRAPVAPPASAARTAASFTSQATTRWPFPSRRVVMFAPIFPNPIIAISIVTFSSSANVPHPRMQGTAFRFSSHTLSPKDAAGSR